ncbi:MAG: hypothetical protein AABM40_04250 [Chloroflexota bacterium]
MRFSPTLLRQVAAILLGMALVASAVALRQTSVEAASDATGAVIFDQPLGLQEAAEMVLRNGLHIIQLVHEIRDEGPQGEGPHWSGGFFPVDQSSPHAVATQYRASQRATQADLLAQATVLTAAIGDSPARIAYRASLASLVTGLDGRVVVRAEVRGSSQQLAALRGDPRVRSVRQVGASQSRSAVAVRRPPGLAAPLMAPPKENWVPDDNYVSVQPSNIGGGRYVSQDFIYNSGRTVDMTDGGGLEMKYHQNNYDGTTYFSRSEDGVRVPIVQTWSSNIPCSYLDTRAGNPLEEPSWHLGSNGDSGCWNAWSAGVWYDNYIRAYPGDADFDTSKAFPTHEQCNHLLGDCDTWAMFQDDYCPQGFWNTAVPIVSWHWNRFTGGDGGQPACM